MSGRNLSWQQTLLSLSLPSSRYWSFLWVYSPRFKQTALPGSKCQRSPNYHTRGRQSAAQVELENRMFQAVITHVEDNPNVSYSGALDAILPISVTLPYEPSGVSVNVRNDGDATATQVRVGVTLDSPIGTIEVTTTNEPWKIVRGAIGENSVTVEIDRLTSQQSAVVTFRLETSSPSARATLTARRAAPFPITTSDFNITSFDDLLGAPANIPLVGFFIDRPSSISPLCVTVTSGEVSGTFALGPTSCPSPPLE